MTATLLVINYLVQSTNGWISHRQIPQRTAALHVLQDPETVSEYMKQRGDGSTGGGGLAMPKSDDEELRRPKVGAEMPKGRPSWFKVPAPSQGMH